MSNSLRHRASSEPADAGGPAAHAGSASEPAAVTVRPRSGLSSARLRNVSPEVSQELERLFTARQQSEEEAVHNPQKRIWVGEMMPPKRIGLLRRMSVALRRYARGEKSKIRRKATKEQQEFDGMYAEEDPEESLRESYARFRNMENLDEFFDQINSPDGRQQHRATSNLRMALSRSLHSLVPDLIEQGLVPLLVSFLRRRFEPELQHEAAVCLTVVSAGTTEQTWTLIEADAIPLLNALVDRKIDPKLSEQACKCLGNIAADCADYRDLVLQSGSLNKVVRLITPSAAGSTLKTSSWALRNFCGGSPRPALELVQPALPSLHMLLTSESSRVKEDSTFAVRDIADGSHERVQAVLNSGVLSRLFNNLRPGYSSHIVPTIKCIELMGNRGSVEQKKFIRDAGVLVVLASVLQPGSGINISRTTRRELARAMSKFTSGPSSSVDELFDTGILELLVTNLKDDYSSEVKQELCWALYNATREASTSQVEKLVSLGALPAIASMLQNITDEDESEYSLPLIMLEDFTSIGAVIAQTRNQTENAFCPQLLELEEWSTIVSLAENGDSPIAATIVMNVWGFDQS